MARAAAGARISTSKRALQRGCQLAFGSWLGSLAACDGADDAVGGDGRAGSSPSSSSGGNAPGSGAGSSSGGKASAGSSSTSAGNSSTPAHSDFPDAQVYVDAHNAVRAAVQKPSNYSGTWLPLPPVTWSDAVAITAQAWAGHLRDALDCGLEHADGTGYGENLAAGTNVDASKAVEMWASEVENFTYTAKYQFSNNTGHYTQIVWRKSTQIGCASARCNDRSVVVCRYDPPGNYGGQPIF